MDRARTRNVGAVCSPESFDPESFDSELTTEGLVEGSTAKSKCRGWKPLPLIP
jgi:hypothetical protein